METNEFIPRPYQNELFEIARKENVIIYLPTGAGKTYIAILLIKELSANIRKSYVGDRKHTMFIANTVVLVQQQSNYIARLTGLSCAALSGDKGIDLWDETKWDAQLKEHEVLVMTPQILVDALCMGYVHLNKINLIIFDECHRAVNDHPMRLIMQNFQFYPKEEQPKVLGLSATLLNSNVQFSKLLSVIKSLEITFNAKIITTYTKYETLSAVPNEQIVEFNNCSVPNIEEYINNIVKEINIILDNLVLKKNLNNESSETFVSKPANKTCMSILIDIQEQLFSTGIYGASKSALIHLIQLESLKKNTDDVELMYIFEYLTTEITKCRKLLEDEMKDNTEIEKIYKYSSDRIKKLFMILKNFYNDNDKKLCCIIFVTRRFTAILLYQILKNISLHDEEYKFLHPEYVIGYSGNRLKTTKEAMCLTEWNNEALYRFRSGLSNCIVATDVIDEGIDIPKCTLVIRYDMPQNVRAYIQSKGRARHISSQYVLLVPKSDLNCLKQYAGFKMIEQQLQEVLLDKNNERNIPTEDEVQNVLYQCELKPYVIVCDDGNRTYITQANAITTVNRYCLSLSKSKFVCLSPIWKLHRISENAESKQFKVSLKLPIVSPLKTVIFGDAMVTIKAAKRSAALKTCIELHKIGELTDYLTINIENLLEKDLNYLLVNWDAEENSDKNVGTKKKKRRHQLQFPTALYGGFPLPQKLVYLHVLHAKPKYSKPYNDNRHAVFYDLLYDSAGFGILSTNQMPEVPSFPIFMNVGEINIDIKVNHAKMYLCKEELKCIKVFHTLIFTEVVSVIKSFMVFDNYNLDNCFLIVPIDIKYNINWEVIRQHQHIEYIPPPIPFHFKTTDYELALVKPNYRAANIYIVTEVCDDITPYSCFPTENFFSYAHYYKAKHDLVINDLKQPMLEVKAISRSIDYITPRGIQGESKHRRYVDKPKDFKEHLVPELCTRIAFPALYWLKATMLPSILHRLSQLLIAEDLRFTIATETRLGSLSNSNKWPPLIIMKEEIEESFETSLETSAMENVDVLQQEPALNGPEVDVLNTESHHYPWSKHEEPPSLYGNIEEIQLIQIEHYYQFMNENSDTVDLEITKDKESYKVNFLNKPSIPIVPLQILSLKGSCDPDPVQIMHALTTKSANDVFNLERLETLGDSYLKFIICLFLYNNFPNYSEGKLTNLKGKIIGNRNLYYCGVKKCIPGRMKIDSFVASSNFIAPAYTVFRQLQKLLLDAQVSPNVLYEIEIPQDEQFSGCISEITKDMMQNKILNWETAELQTGMEHYLGIQTVSDKAVADCVEALIGVYLRSVGIKDTVTLLKWFQILPNDIDSDALLHGVPNNPIISTGNIDSLMPWASNIETTLGYQFKNRGYLLQAYTHPSYTANNMTECYQRLEFLGDAILDFLITCYIYENFGNFNPGALTDLRSALVNNITFASLSVRHGLHTALLSYTPELDDIINRFVKFQEERNFVINDEILWILLEEDECNISEHVDVPKVLGDIFESTIGAIYLDSNKSLTTVWEIIYSIMHKEIDEFSKNIPKQPVRVLYEFQGAEPQFSKPTIVESAVMVSLKVTIAGKIKHFYGFGNNKSQAKCAAAKQALKSLLHKS